MTLRLGALEDALIHAGSEPELARKAAEEGADYAWQLVKLRGELRVLKFLLGLVGALLGVTLLVLGQVW